MKYAFSLLFVSLFFFACQPNTSQSPTNNGGSTPSNNPTTTAPPTQNTQAGEEGDGGGIALPPGLDPALLTITDVNFYEENGYLYVIGLTENKAKVWQKPYLKVEGKTANGVSIKFGKKDHAFVPVIADAVPPGGRSAFFWFWPISMLSERPATVNVTAAAAKKMEQAAIMVVTDVAGTKVMQTFTKPDSTTYQVEQAWTLSAILNNPLEMTVEHPRLEMLLYGNDKKLWYARLLSAEDTPPTLFFEKPGPILAGEKRVFGLDVIYRALPTGLKDSKIGRAEFLAWEKRE